MKFGIVEAIEVLGRTPGVLRAMLDGVSASWAMSNYGPGTFSPFDVVGHLIHGERTDWIPRARIIVEHGPDRPFEPFDRYAMFEDSKGKSRSELLDTFETLRRDNLATLESMGLAEADLDRPGSHPELGRVDLRALLSTWVVHDLNHVSQIAKAMAFQYETEVGAWRPYLSILSPPASRSEYPTS